MWKELILIVATFGVVNALIGMRFYQNDTTTCALKLYRLPTLDATDWITLDADYQMPCYDVLNHPNQAHFTLARNKSGQYFITAIFADSAAKMYKVAYLDPAVNEFTPFKNIDAPENCFNPDSLITASLNFNGQYHAGKIHISHPSGCEVKISEGKFFGNQTTLGVFKTVRGRPQVTMDDNEYDNRIYETFQQDPQNLDNMVLQSEQLYSPFVLPFKVSKPAMFACGKYIFYKNLGYNMTAAEDFYTYAMLDVSPHPQSKPWGTISTTFSWPNFIYIFDDALFDKPGLKNELPIAPTGVPDGYGITPKSKSSASNGNGILTLPMMLALIAAFCKINSY